MAQISIDTLHGEGVIFVVNIEDMLPRKDDIQISRVPICAITFRNQGEPRKICVKENKRHPFSQESEQV